MTRELVLILGDQLSRTSPLVTEAGPDTLFVMAEVRGDVERHRNHKARVAFFLSAMRHFASDLRKAGQYCTGLPAARRRRRLAHAP